MAIEELKPFFIGYFAADRQNGVMFKLNHRATFSTNQMMVMGGTRAIEFVIFIVITQIQFAQNPHLRHQLQGSVDRGNAHINLLFMEHIVQRFRTEMFAAG